MGNLKMNFQYLLLASISEGIEKSLPLYVSDRIQPGRISPVQ